MLLHSYTQMSIAEQEGRSQIIQTPPPPEQFVECAPLFTELKNLRNLSPHCKKSCVICPKNLSEIMRLQWLKILSKITQGYDL